MTAFDVLNLADGAFPTGAHGHSGGLEYAIQAGWVGDRASFAAWCRRALESAVFTLGSARGGEGVARGFA